MHKETLNSGDEAVVQPTEQPSAEASGDSDRPAGATGSDGSVGDGSSGEHEPVLAGGISAQDEHSAGGGGDQSERSEESSAVAGESLSVESRLDHLEQLHGNSLEFDSEIAKLVGLVRRQLNIVEEGLEKLSAYVHRFHPRPPRTCEACGRALADYETGKRHAACKGTAPR